VSFKSGGGVKVGKRFGVKPSALKNAVSKSSKTQGSSRHTIAIQDADKYDPKKFEENARKAKEHLESHRDYMKPSSVWDT